MTILTMIILVMLLLFLQGKLYRKYWHRGLSLRLSFSAAEAFEGDRLSLRQELTNAKLLPLPWIIAKFRLSRHLMFVEEGSYRVSDDLYQSDLYSVAMYQRVIRSQDFLCCRRGHYRIKSADLTSTDIFIAGKLVENIPCDAQLTVLPKPLYHPILDDLFRRLYGDMEVRRFTNPDPFAFRGVREYTSRDDFRLINWGASAKTGDLMVNVHSSTAARELVVLLGLEPYSDQPDEDVMEETIRLAASAADCFCRLGNIVSLYSNGRDIESGDPVQVLPGSGSAHYHHILEKLARINLAAGQSPMLDHMDGLVDTSPVYLLISAYDREDIQNAFAGMLARGLSARWLVPAPAENIIWVEETAEITRWEVIPHAMEIPDKDIAV